MSVGTPGFLNDSWLRPFIPIFTFTLIMSAAAVECCTLLVVAESGRDQSLERRSANQNVNGEWEATSPPGHRPAGLFWPGQDGAVGGTEPYDNVGRGLIQPQRCLMVNSLGPANSK